MIAFIGFFSFAPPTFLLKKKSRQKKTKIERQNPFFAFFWFFSFSVGVGAFDDPKNRQNKRTLEDVGPYKGSLYPLDCFLLPLFFCSSFFF